MVLLDGKRALGSRRVQDIATTLEPAEAAEVRARLAALAGFAGNAAETRLVRLPGLSNRVYRVDTARGRFVLRIPGVGTAAIIDRRTEETNARAAAKAGLSPEVLHFGADGVMLTRFIDDAEPLSPSSISTRDGALERVGLALRRLHESGAPFAGRFDAFATIEAYAAVLLRAGRAPHAGVTSILAEAETVKAALAADPPALRPCHCDPTPRNLLDTGARVWLVDWEYSGLNDPAWDLAYCSIQCGLPPDADVRLLRAYRGGEPSPAETARLAAMKAPVELMSALWALIQESAGNGVADFGAYAARTFQAAAERMRSTEFRAALAGLRAA